MQMVFDAQAVADRLDVAQRVNAASPPLVKWARSAHSGCSDQTATRKDLANWSHME